MLSDPLEGGATQGAAESGGTTAERRPVITDPVVLEALAHPVRLDLLTYLMSAGPATASTCARAVGDTPSNCSYHLRTLARHGLVEPVESDDGRQRPWRATITGFAVDPLAEPGTPEGEGAAAVLSASVAREQHLLRQYLARRDEDAPAWRSAAGFSTYTIRATPDEVRHLEAQIDALVRPLIAARRDPAGVPDDAELVQLGVYAFPRQGEPWRPAAR